jgi:hypothetical protein
MPKLIMDEILSSPVELNTDPSAEQPKEEIQEEVKPVEEAPQEKLESLEEVAKSTNDAVPLAKYMSEKNARRDAEVKAKELETEITRLREVPKSEVDVDVKSLSDKHGIDEEVLRDILNASYTMTKGKVREELEAELSPKLAEIEQIKREKEVQTFENKFENILSDTIKSMPEYKDLIDKEDVKDWIKSGRYSKLTMSELIEQKYSKFVTGKKSIESGQSIKESVVPDVSNMTDADYANLDKNPELRKKWAEGLEDRLRNLM